MNKLEPCPFCGSSQVKFESWQTDTNDKHFEMAIICQNCGARGPNELNPAQAFQMWNMRREPEAAK